jgi:hypothetical protein
MSVRWFYKLVHDSNSKTPALLKYVPDAESKLIISQHTPKGKKFAVFPSYLEFYRFQKSVALTSKNFFEIIPSGSQKPHFDIDIADDNPKFIELNTTLNKVFTIVVDDLISAILYVFNTHNLKIDIEKNLRLYTSHSANKKSLHLIIVGYYHRNHKQAREFYNLCMNRIKDINKESEKYKVFYDDSVYKSRQQFRCLGSTKSGIERTKKLWSPFIFEGENYTSEIMFEHTDNNKGLIEFAESLVTFVTGSAMLPDFLDESVSDSNQLFESEELTEEDAVLCVKMFFDYMFKFNIRVPLKHRGISGNMILFERQTKAYMIMCPLCKYAHQNENPFIYVVHRIVFYNCRRNLKGKSAWLGTLPGYEPPEVQCTIPLPEKFNPELMLLLEQKKKNKLENTRDKDNTDNTENTEVKDNDIETNTDTEENHSIKKKNIVVTKNKKLHFGKVQEMMRKSELKVRVKQEPEKREYNIHSLL